jgi:hypothetical protein
MTSPFLRGRPPLPGSDGLKPSRESLGAAGAVVVVGPERVLATRLTGLEVVNVHSPISPKPGLAKVLTHEAVHAHLSEGRGPVA